MTLDPARQVFVTSTPAAADACASILGVQAVCALDLSPADLAGCRVVIWPSNRAIAITAAMNLCIVAYEHGAASVKMVTPGALCEAGWDAAAALAEGYDRDGLVEWLRAHTGEWAPEASAEADPIPAGQERAPPPRSQPPEPPRPAPARALPFPAHGTAEEKLEALGIDFGKPPANEDTVMLVLEGHPDFQDAIWYDEFLGRIMTTGAAGPREWTDADDVATAVTLQRTLGLKRCKVSHVRAAVIARAHALTRNCAQEWLRSLKWDGTERLASFFSDICGAPNTAYTQAVGRNFWISMVARVMEPGCKVDNMVILEGAQGARKSSLLKAIGGDWYTVQHETVTGKGFFEVLQGKMLVEIAEMDAFGKAEVTRVKQVVSTESDRYRESYGRHAKDHPRHSIFVGTTNKDDWNRDETGARRFWPIRVSNEIDLDALRAIRSQLFAEAVVALDGGASWWVMPAAETQAQQDERRQEDSWTDIVTDWIIDGARTRVTLHQVLDGALGLRRVEMQRPQEMRVAAILRQMGWTKKNSGGRRYWDKGETTT